MHLDNPFTHSLPRISEEPEYWVEHRVMMMAVHPSATTSGVPGSSWFKFDADGLRVRMQSALADVIPLQDSTRSSPTYRSCPKRTRARSGTNYRSAATNPRLASAWSDAIAQLGPQKFDGSQQRTSPTTASDRRAAHPTQPRPLSSGRFR